jgi:hypothetical protein
VRRQRRAFFEPAPFLFLMPALAGGGTAFTEKLCGYLGYGNLLLRFCSRTLSARRFEQLIAPASTDRH